MIKRSPRDQQKLFNICDIDVDKTLISKNESYGKKNLI